MIAASKTKEYVEAVTSSLCPLKAGPALWRGLPALDEDGPGLGTCELGRRYLDTFARHVRVMTL